MNMNIFHKKTGKELIQEGLNDFFNNPDLTDLFSVDYWDEDNPDIFHWKVLMYGQPESIYEGGYFLLKIDFPPEYPSKKPEVRFKTKIYHSNVDQNNGHVCISTLNNWNSFTTKPKVKEILDDIAFLMWNPTPEKGYGIVDKECMEEPLKFEKNAKDWLEKYANVDDYDDPTKNYA